MPSIWRIWLLQSVELHPDADIEIEAHAFGDNKQLCNISSQNSPSARINKNALRSTSEYSWDSEEAYLKLKCWESRYFGYPVHRPKLCYHASTTTVVELRKAAIECKATVKPDLGYSSFGSDPDDGSDASDVSFGDPALDASFNLTPFHVLLSAAKRRTDLLEVLLDKFPLHACSDNGKTCGVIGLWNSWLETGMETPGKWQR
ncbi:unnamed protein product [Cylindrotheca closterium]|uniref:Uncharacterized protein n=1 Tax=Cylindrotheca closterium TaxID=2856 RepID=A0AAD2GD12_9STRA|nr:unnamed protein product [Cylindrotheca closterium]